MAWLHQHDPIGRLRQRATVGTTDAPIQSLYDGVNLIAEYDAANILQRRFVHGPGVDEPLVQYEGVTTTNKSWFYADHQGSVVATADSAGVSTGIYSYGPYGEPNNGGPARFRYTGQQYFDNLGLYYYKARFYSPTLGKFMQTDPIGYADDLNLYAYVRNNPVNRRDPTGLYWFQQDWQAADPIVGREGTFVEPGGSICTFIEKYVLAGRTLGEIHDPLVDALNRAGVSDWLANIPTMIPAFVAAIGLEVLRTFGIVDQPAPPAQPTQPTQPTPSK